MVINMSPSFHSPSPTRSSRPNSNGKSVTLASHISNERLREEEDDEQNQKSTTTSDNGNGNFSPRLRKQKSCREFNTFDNNNNNNTMIGRSKSTTGYSFSDNSLMKKSRSHNQEDIIVPRNLSQEDNTFVSSDKLKKLLITKQQQQQKQKVVTIERAKSLITTAGYKSSKSQWALSPGRSGSPPMSVESKDIPFSFSTLRPHAHSHTTTTVDKILSFRFHDLFSSNKLPSSTSSSEAAHHLRLLNNRLLHWHFANSKAHAVNRRMSCQAETKLVYALYDFTKLQRSVLQKKMQLQREKLEIKLNYVLHSQMKLLEAWGDIESQHVDAIAVMKECLDSVVTKVPLLEGAKVDIQLAFDAQRHATDLTNTIMSILSNFSPLADKTVELFSKLTEVIAQEKLLLKEINNILKNMCVLEIKESSLKCSLIQLKFLAAD